MLKWGAGTLLRPSQWLLEVTTWINFGEFLRMVKSHIVSCQGVYFKDRNSGLITTSSTDRSIWKQIRIWYPHESFVWLSWTEVLPGQRFEAYLGAWKWVRGQWAEWITYPCNEGPHAWAYPPIASNGAPSISRTSIVMSVLEFGSVDTDSARILRKYQRVRWPDT